MNKEDITGYECKHAVYSKSTGDNKDDLLIIKENIHLKDGSVVPNLRMIKNFKRDFWITKHGFQNHTDKKEWEDIDKLQKFSTTQYNLIDAIGRATGRPGVRGGLRTVARNQFLYGCDITTPTLIKHKYQTKYPNAISDNTVAVMDIETDVVNGTNAPIYIAITYRDKAFLATTKAFMGTIVNPEEKLKALTNKLLGKYVKERNIKLEVMVCKDEGEMCYEAIQRAHQWQPDFLTFWNIDFDLPRIAETLERFNYNLADVFSDPRVPPEFRFFKYRKGKAQKVTASGLITPIHPADRWHKAECPASFFLIDSMCVYKRIRITAPNEPSYSLDYQLNKHLGVRKLNFEEADGYTGLAWHEFMQTNYKIEYGVYNLFDCIGVELFDDKVKDLAQSITVQAGPSEYTIFDSQPSRLVDKMYFFCLEKGKVIASCSDQMRTDLDRYVVSKKNWIITLPSHLTIDNGLKVIKELPGLITYIRVHVADLDVAAGLNSPA